MATARQQQRVKQTFMAAEISTTLISQRTSAHDKKYKYANTQIHKYTNTKIRKGKHTQIQTGITLIHINPAVLKWFPPVEWGTENSSHFL